MNRPTGWPWVRPFLILPDLRAYLSSILKIRYKELLKVPPGEATQYGLDDRPETGDLLLLVKSDDGAMHIAPVPLITLLAWEIVKTQFDGLLVIAPENHLIAQDRRLPEQPLGQQVALQLRKRNPAFAEFLAGKQPGGDPAPRAPGSVSDQNDSPPSGPSSLDPLSPDFSEDASIQLGGVDYVAFLQIVSAPLSPRDPAGSNTTNSHSSLSFLVCGLISRDRLNSSVFQLGSVLTQETFTSYPEFEAIAITNLCGRQVRKWMTRTLPTPNVDTGDLSYFQPALTKPLAAPGSHSFAFGTSLAKTSGLMLGVYAVLPRRALLRGDPGRRFPGARGPRAPIEHGRLHRMRHLQVPRQNLSDAGGLR